MAIRVVSIISRMNVGGPAVLISELVARLPNEEFEHILITGSCQSNEIDYLDTHPFASKVVRIDEIQRSFAPFHEIKSFIKLLRTLKSLNPDLVHTHTSKAGVLGRIATKIAAPKAKIVHTYHGHLLYGYFPKWKTRLVILLEQSLSKISDCLVGVTNQVKSDLLSVGIGCEAKWRVIRPGLETPVSISKESAMKSLSISSEKFVIAWIGRFTEIKNPLLAVQSIQEIPAQILNRSILLMAGDGDLRIQTEEYAKKHSLPVIFLGWVPDVSNLLAAADLLLVSSRNEGMPVVVLEAALRGVPTLSTNVGGVAEFVINQETGWLVSQDSQLIGAVLSEAVLDESIKTIGANAKQLVENEFSLQSMIDNHIRLYKSLIVTMNF